MKEFIFAIDVDEVLRENLCNMLKVYNEEYNDNKSFDDILDFQVDKSFPKIMETTGTTASKFFFEDHAKEVFTDSCIINGAKDAVDILKKYGKVIIVTYQKNDENKTRTLEWLSNNNIQYDGICFLRDKSIVHADYLIDDNDWNFIGCNCKHGILINKPYNKDTDLNELVLKSNCEHIDRFNSLIGFAKWFENNIKIFEKIY